MVRHRGDVEQARILEVWLTNVLEQYSENILAFDSEAAQVWGRLRVPHPEHELDKQAAAIALVNDLTVVTGNAADFQGTGVRLLNPFLPPVDGKLEVPTGRESRPTKSRFDGIAGELSAKNCQSALAVYQKRLKYELAGGFSERSVTGNLKGIGAEYERLRRI